MFKTINWSSGSALTTVSLPEIKIFKVTFRAHHLIANSLKKILGYVHLIIFQHIKKLYKSELFFTTCRKFRLFFQRFWLSCLPNKKSDFYWYSILIDIMDNFIFNYLFAFNKMNKIFWRSTRKSNWFVITYNVDLYFGSNYILLNLSNLWRWCWFYCVVIVLMTSHCFIASLEYSRSGDFKIFYFII